MPRRTCVLSSCESERIRIRGWVKGSRIAGRIRGRHRRRPAATRCSRSTACGSSWPGAARASGARSPAPSPRAARAACWPTSTPPPRPRRRRSCPGRATTAATSTSATRDPAPGRSSGPPKAGALDVLVNSAGRLHLAPALELDGDDFESVLRLNAAGAFLIAREAARAMKDTGGGRVITIASVSSRVTNPGYAAYATSKGALVQLTRILALEWAQYGITVNAIGPAMTPTAMTENYLEETGSRQYALDCIPMGRFGTPGDLFGTALLLAAPGGGFITGQTLYVDGGRTLR
ncbi:MAG: SDR family oxidoreductase [Halofilum sp. (in: g-proteobacteria)]|nr:SDR family oxidoreductase [Halofilum sp. (in: g-proteobacteria)]